MQKFIIGYSLGKIEPKKRLRFNQELYGYIDHSNKGKYVYNRSGILSATKYEKPLDSTLVLPALIVPAVIAHLKKYHAKYITYELKESLAKKEVVPK